MTLHRRLFQLHVAVFLQGFMLWVPVEKLFQTSIGFDPADLGLEAAAYPARWSRRGVLIVASLALAASSLIGGVSQDVPTYIAGAMVLGVYFAFYNGRMDSVV